MVELLNNFFINDFYLWASKLGEFWGHDLLMTFSALLLTRLNLWACASLKLTLVHPYPKNVKISESTNHFIECPFIKRQKAGQGGRWGKANGLAYVLPICVDWLCELCGLSLTTGLWVCRVGWLGTYPDPFQACYIPWSHSLRTWLNLLARWT